MWGGLLQLDNAGSISATYQAISAGSGSVILNRDTGTISGAGGISALDSLSVDNAGSISATYQAISAGSGSVILNRDTGTISGAGGISALGSLSVDNAGSVQATDKAISASGALSVTNSGMGTITATNDAIFGGAGVVVSNDANARISGARGISAYSAIELQNLGDISATDVGLWSPSVTLTNHSGANVSGSRMAIYADGGSSTIVNEAGATISSTAPGPTYSQATIFLGGGSSHVVNAGTISGLNAITFRGANSILELHPGSVINGAVLAVKPNMKLVLSGTGADSFEISGLSSQYIGFNSLQKSGDSVWTMTGAYAGATSWILEDGTLSVANAGALGASGTLSYLGGILDLQNGASVAHNVSLHDSLAMDLGDGVTGTLSGAISQSGGSFGLTKSGGGTLVLSGNSSFTGDTTVSGGTLINNGTLMSDVFVDSATYAGTGASGNLEANSGSVVAPGDGGVGTLNVNGDVALNDGSTYEINVAPDGTGDLLAATGAVSISAAGTILSIVGNPADMFPPIGDYTIVTADGGVTGQFETVTDNLPDIDFATVYGTNDVRLAYVMDNVFSPKDVHPSATIAGLDASRLYANTLREHAAGLAAGGWLPDDETLRGRELWMSAFGAGTGVRASGATTGWDGAIGGIAFGVNGMFDLHGRSVIAGASAGYSETGVDAGVSGHADVRSFHAGLDGAAEYGSWLLSGAIGAAYQDYDFSRIVPYGGGSVLAEGSADGFALTASARAFFNAAPRFSDAPDYRLGPYASLDIVQAWRGSFSETGAGILDLTVGSDEAGQFIGGLGLAAGGAVMLGERQIEIDLAAGWEHVFGDTEITTASTIPVTGLDFTAQSSPISRDRLSASVSATYAISDRVSATLGYGVKISSDDSVHAGNARLSLRF